MTLLKKIHAVWLCSLVLVLSYEYSNSLNSIAANNATNVTAEEAEAKHFLQEISPRLETLNTEQVNATWKFNTDINDENEARLVSRTSKLNHIFK